MGYGDPAHKAREDNAVTNSIDLDKYVPKDAKVTHFDCINELDDSRQGIVMEFDSGKRKVIRFDKDDACIKLFAVGDKGFAIVPGDPAGKLVQYNLSAALLSKNAFVNAHGVNLIEDTKTHKLVRVGLFQQHCYKAPKPDEGDRCCFLFRR